MYALIHNSQLLLGPIRWNYRMINSDLEEELELDHRVTPDDWQSVPIKVNNETYIVEAKEVIPEHDPKYYNVGNFTWEKEYIDLTKTTSLDSGSFPSQIEITEIIANDYGHLICTIPGLQVSPGFKVLLKGLSFSTPTGNVSIDDGEYLVHNVDENGSYIFEGFSVDHEFTYLGNAYVENEINVSSVIFTYAIHEKTLDEVKYTYKQQIAPVRREKENKIISIDINGTEVEVSTSREERSILASKLASSTQLYNYKFKNIWLEVTQQDIQNIIDQIDQKVQEAFDWEFLKNQEIDSCQTIDEVYSVVIKESTLISLE